MDDSKAPWHAHIYYAPADRAQGFRARLIRLKESGETGTPIDLDLTVLDPPGINQGFARFGKTDF